MHSPIVSGCTHLYLSSYQWVNRLIECPNVVESTKQQVMNIHRLDFDMIDNRVVMMTAVPIHMLIVSVHMLIVSAHMLIVSVHMSLMSMHIDLLVELVTVVYMDLLEQLTVSWESVADTEYHQTVDFVADIA